MLARVSAYEALPTAKLQVPTAPAQAGCGFLKGRRESEFSEQASPEAAGGPGRQREEAEGGIYPAEMILEDHSFPP